MNKEVKEVDLKKTLTGFQNRYAYENSGEWPSAIEIAEYFFELGFNWHKEPMEENLTKKIGDLINEVGVCIASNPSWVYYFLNPLGSENEEIVKCMMEHPDDWEDYISFSVTNMSSVSVSIDINIDDGSELGICLKRYICLPIFSETVNRNKKLYGENLISSRLNHLKEDIERLKEILKEKEDNVKELEGLNK